MTPPLFAYYLLDNSNPQQYYYIDSLGNVSLSLTKKKLEESPLNWKDTSLSIGRNEIDFGIFTKFSVPLEFVLTASKIIRYLYHTTGYESYCKFVIEKREDYNWTYEPYFSGEIDFKEIINELDKTTVNIMEGGLSSVYAANKNLEVEIPIDGDTDAIVINHDGHKLRNKATFVVTTPIDSNIAMAGSHVPSITLVNTEASTNIDIQEKPSGVNLTGLNAFNEKSWIFKASANTAVDIEYDFSLEIIPVSGINYATAGLVCRIFTRDSNGSVVTAYSPILINESNFSIYLNTLYVLQGTVSLNLNLGDQVYLQTFFMGSTIPANFIYNSSPSVKGLFVIAYNSLFPSSDIKAFRYFHFAKKVIQKALGSQYNIVSSFLTSTTSALPYNLNFDNNPWDTAITSGSAIRQLNNPVVKSSIEKIRKDLWRWGLGIGIEGDSIVIEKLQYFMNKNVVVASISDVSNIKETCAKQFLANSVKVGYPENTYDNLNGLDDFNCQLKFSLPSIRGEVKELDWTSEFEASIYAIEYARALLYQKDTTDSQYENKVYLLEITDYTVNGKYQLLRLGGTKNWILNEDTAYNFGLSPKRTLLRNAPYLKSILAFPNQTTIKFLTGNKNTLLSTIFFATPPPSPTFYPPVTENIDEIIQMMIGDPIFTPSIIEFETVLPSNFFTNLLANPYGRVNIIDLNNNAYSGFILSAEIKDATNDIHSVKMLAAYGTNLDTINS